MRPEPVFVGASQMRMRAERLLRGPRLRVLPPLGGAPGPPERLALCPPQEMPHASCYHEPLMRGRVGGRVALGLRAENHAWRGYRARMVFLQISMGSEGTGSKDRLISVTWMAGVRAGVPDWRWPSCSPEPRPQAPHPPHTGKGGPGSRKAHLGDVARVAQMESQCWMVLSGSGEQSRGPRHARE